ncbi:hypothetical protein [Intestinibacillus massiliensis]
MRNREIAAHGGCNLFLRPKSKERATNTAFRWGYGVDSKHSKRVLVCCACYVVVFIRKRLFLSLWAFCLRRIFAAQSGQYFARLLPAANVLPHTAQRFKSVSPLRVICSQSCLSAGNTASRK